MAEGFVIAPFMNPADNIYTIPPDTALATPIIRADENPETLPLSTTPDQHRREVEAIIRRVSISGGKTVAARISRIDGAIDLEESFSALCRAYPDAFIYMFHTERTGTWIGATPELLLNKVCSTLYTMALAGTRPTDSSGGWDHKNIEEQSLVTDFIISVLKPYSSSICIGNTFTKKAGPVEHICTPITAFLDNYTNPVSILGHLSPTPAVCGSDRQDSLETIMEFEHFSRGMYGGFCGPSYAAGDFTLFVTLRCAQCSADAISIYTGGGITPLSDPDSEWTETELKASTLKNILKFK